MTKMKPLKTILLSGFLTLGAFSLIAYTSCNKKDKDKCDGVVCQHNGTCVDGSCKCPTGYEGANCETPSSKKFAGSYNATDNCPLGDRTGDSLLYMVTIIPDNADPLKVSIIGIANQPNSSLFVGTAAGNTLTIPDQEIDGRSYSGTITYEDPTTLSMSFTIKENGSAVEACTSVLKK